MMTFGLNVYENNTSIDWVFQYVPGSFPMPFTCINLFNSYNNLITK